MVNPNRKPTKEELYELYINQGKTSREIAEMYNLTIDIIKNNLKSYGIRKGDNTITAEDLKAEADKLLNEKLAHEGLLNKKVETPVEEPNVNIDDILVKTFEPDTYFSDCVPLKWQGIFNMVTRMYEANEDYQYVRYNQVRDTIQIVLNKKKYNAQTELPKVKNLLNYDTLNYTLVEDESEKFVIEIGIK